MCGSIRVWLAAGFFSFVILCGPVEAQVDRFYGEPVELTSDFIYFTSWKYVRQASLFGVEFH